eukprot:s2356_g26.t1
MPTGATLRNAYRSRKGDGDREVGDQMKVPQSFTCMAREGLPGQGYNLQLEDILPRRLRSEGNARDIYCMVKSLCHQMF